MTVAMGENQNYAEGNRPRPCCPCCDGIQTKPIIYGFVDVGEYLELGTRVPDFELGGLATRDENWCCVQCSHRWAE
jgi:hypothetical protein